MQVGMEHMLGKDWQEAFDVVIVQSEKPNFFGVQDRPFEIMPENHERTVSARNEVMELKKGEIYCGGCCNELMRLKKWTSGEVSCVLLSISIPVSVCHSQSLLSTQCGLDVKLCMNVASLG